MADDPTALTKSFKSQTLSRGVKWTSFGTGPPLVFVHGTPWSSRLWAPIARCFSAAFTVYLYDLPGYGESIPAPEPGYAPTYPRQADVLAELFQHWQGLNDASWHFVPHVIAHDIGGHIVLRLALLRDDIKLASLALVDCGAAFPVDEAFFALVRQQADVFCGLPPKLHEALLREYVRGASHRGLRPDQEDALIAPWLSANGQRAFYRQIEYQRNEDIATLSAAYRKLECPLHIIWAAQDAWVPVERAHKLHEKIGGSLKIIEGSGHLVQLDAPEALMWELIEWLRQVAGVGGAKSKT